MSDYTDNRFNEKEAIKLLSDYIDSTYGKHYSMNKIQSTEFIFDAGHGDGFCLGNIIKYAQRFGKKDGRNLDDLLKILHYAIILLGVENENKEARKLIGSEYK